MLTETQWIDPTGGLGDVLMLSGVLKLAHDRLGKKYNLIRRTDFSEMLAGHPGIERIDYLPKGAPVLSVAYGRREEMRNGSIPRAFQMLAKMFGLQLPVPETLYLPMDGVSALPASMVPWREKNVAIAPDSGSPRKVMPRHKWEQVAKALSASGALVVQLGKGGAEKVKYAYSLAGVTTPKEAILLLKRMDLLITSDNFLMHAAHLTGTPAISLWGPTEAGIYGYAEHQRIISSCTYGAGKCRVASFFDKCSAPKHCMDGIDADEIVARALKALGGGQAVRRGHKEEE